MIYTTIDDALESTGSLPIDYTDVQGLLARLHPTADQSKLSNVAVALCRAAFVFGVVGVETDMRTVRDHLHRRLDAADGLFKETPFLKVLEVVEGERGKMVRVTVRNEVEAHSLECWAEWRSTPLGAPTVVLLVTRGQ